MELCHGKSRQRYRGSVEEFILTAGALHIKFDWWIEAADFTLPTVWKKASRAAYTLTLSICTLEFIEFENHDEDKLVITLQETKTVFTFHTPYGDLVDVSEIKGIQLRSVEKMVAA